MSGYGYFQRLLLIFDELGDEMCFDLMCDSMGGEARFYIFYVVMWKSWLYSGVIVLISFYLIVNTSRKVWQLWESQSAVDVAELELKQAYDEQAKLEKSLAYQQTDAYVEEQARERLNLVKPEETVVLMPKSIPKIVYYTEKTPEAQEWNWEKWLKRFMEKN